VSDNPYGGPQARVEDSEQSDPGARSSIARFWRGQARLWQAFWLLLVLGYVAMVTLFLVAVALFSSANPTILIIVLVAASTVNIAFFVFALVSVWRCAPNTNTPALTSVARILVLALVALLALQFIQGVRKGSRMIEERLDTNSRALPSISRAFC
jgi:hypothetical protein